MVRKIDVNDRDIYFKMADEFYSGDAVMKKIPFSHISDTFDELIKGSPYCDCFVCQRGETVCGYVLTAKTFSQEGGGFTVWVEELYCLPDFRGSGVASELMDFVEAHYCAKRFRLEVEPYNEIAVRLYKKHGYDFIPYQQMLKEEDK